MAEFSYIQKPGDAPGKSSPFQRALLNAQRKMRKGDSVPAEELLTDIANFLGRLIPGVKLAFKGNTSSAVTALRKAQKFVADAEAEISTLRDASED
jgi:hypothetical protein